MDIGRHGNAELAADLPQERATIADGRSAKGVHRGAIRLVVGGLETNCTSRPSQIVFSLRPIRLVKAGLSITQGPKMNSSFFPPSLLRPILTIRRGIEDLKCDPQTRQDFDASATVTRAASAGKLVFVLREGPRHVPLQPRERDQYGDTFRAIAVALCDQAVRSGEEDRFPDVGGAGRGAGFVPVVFWAPAMEIPRDHRCGNEGKIGSAFLGTAPVGGRFPCRRLCRKASDFPADVRRYIERTAEVRGRDAEDLAGFEKVINDFIEDSPSGLDVKAWSSRQVYIALGSFMTSAALLGVDTCPMAGFDPRPTTRRSGWKEAGSGPWRPALPATGRKRTSTRRFRTCDSRKTK